MNKELWKKCRLLLDAYNSGKMGSTAMPEDANPRFLDVQKEEKISYFTLPMALNYQRNSYNLWESALKTWDDQETRAVFNIADAAKMREKDLRKNLLKYKLALQPNKHVNTWHAIARTIFEEWGTISNLIEFSGKDFLKLREIVQKINKRGFPYLSGPKIFNYWSFILMNYGGVDLKNKEFIEIAPDTHVTKCSVLLGVINEREAIALSKEEISKRWRNMLRGSGIDPIDMHPPLWFWSRNGFVYQLDN